MRLEGKQSSLSVPERHVDSVRSLVSVLESRAWVADFISDILDHYRIYGINTCTPEWVAEQVAGPALFLRREVQASANGTKEG